MSYSSSCHHHSIILSFNIIQNGNILILVNPGLSGKMAIKMESECAGKKSFEN